MLKIKAHKGIVDIHATGTGEDVLIESITILNALSSKFEQEGGKPAEEMFRVLVKKWVYEEF